MTSTTVAQRRICEGTLIDTPATCNLRIRESSVIGVDESGTIAFIEKSITPAYALSKHGWPTDTPIISGTQLSHKRNSTTFFFPGFIDTHTHAPQYPNVGIFGSSTLLDWLETYTFPLESSFKDLNRARHVYNRVVQRSLSNGTTAVAYHATVHVPATNLLADICFERGQRALVGRVCMDRMSPDDYRDESVESAVRDSEASIAYIQSLDPEGVLVRPVITPRFAPSCTEDCLHAMGALHQRSGCWAQTHISENHAEIAMVRELFPKAKHYTGVYDDTGLLTDKTILAHGVHLEDAEIELIKHRGAKISHCPASNTCITSGAARMKKLMRRGVDVSLGTDMSGGYSSSILEMVRQALFVSRHAAMVDGDDAKLSITEALWLGTCGGARCMGLEETIGSFEVGKHWDAQLVVLDHVDEHGDGNLDKSGPVDIFGWEHLEDQVAKWVYGGDDRNVGAVWVKGRLVHSASIAKDLYSVA